MRSIILYLYDLFELLAQVVDRSRLIIIMVLYLRIRPTNLHGLGDDEWSSLVSPEVFFRACLSVPNSLIFFSIRSTQILLAVKSGLGLHQNLLQAVTKASLLYFSTTDSGDILNR